MDNYSTAWSDYDRHGYKATTSFPNPESNATAYQLSSMNCSEKWLAEQTGNRTLQIAAEALKKNINVIRDTSQFRLQVALGVDRDIWPVNEAIASRCHWYLTQKARNAKDHTITAI